jgi:multicomponent K+:H+ antiporter subunit G
MSELGIEVVSLLADFLALGGALLFLISAIGLLRLPDFFCRVHAPTKAATLGVLLLGFSSVVRSLAQGDLVWLEDVAILVFVCLTIPVSSQVLARAALRRGVAQVRQAKQAAPNELSN